MSTSIPASTDISKELKGKIDALKLNFYDLENAGVDYKSMDDSKAFSEYKRAAEGLERFDLEILATREAKPAFWINIYNALVVHGILALLIRFRFDPGDRAFLEQSGHDLQVVYNAYD